MEDNKDKIIYIPVEDILPNRFQPRLSFDEKELNELANSILKYGVIQPIVLRQIGDKYEIIAGERRYKASCIAGLKKVPAIINNTDDNTSAEIALLENLQRKNLTVIEEAQSYKKLLDRGFTQDDIAQKLGISQSSIANKIRLLNLPVRVQDALLYNQISERHARSLLSLNNEDLQINLLNKIVSEKLTVKQTEDEIALILGKGKKEEQIDTLSKFLNPGLYSNQTNSSSDNMDFIDINKKEYNFNEEQKNLLEPQVETPVVEPLNNSFEVIDLDVPEVVDIVEEKSNENETSTIKETIIDSGDINPFQLNNENIDNNIFSPREDIINDAIEETTYVAEEKPIIEEFISVQNKPQQIVEEEEEHEPIKQNNSLLNEYGEVNLPRVIDKVRTFVTSLDEVSNLITTSEMDLDGKYQIIIEIDKNTPM